MNILANPTVQWITLFVSIGVFLFIPIIHRNRLRRLREEQAAMYKKVAVDTYVRLFILVCIGCTVAGMRGYASGDLAKPLSSSYLAILFSGSLGALWTIRNSHLSYLAATKKSLKGNRKSQLIDVYERNLEAFTLALLGALIGGVGVFVIEAGVVNQPSWFWFAAFMLSAIVIGAQTNAVAVQHVASLYEHNKTHGAKLTGRRDR
jgi:hypothetical protein